MLAAPQRRAWARRALVAALLTVLAACSDAAQWSQSGVTEPDLKHAIRGTGELLASGVVARVPEGISAAAPVPWADVRFVWLDRGRLASALARCDAAGRFEVRARAETYVAPRVRGTLYASRPPGRIAFAALEDVPVGSTGLELMGDDAANVFAEVEAHPRDEGSHDQPRVTTRLLMRGSDGWVTIESLSAWRTTPLRFARPALPFELDVAGPGHEPAVLGPFLPGDPLPPLVARLAPKPRRAPLPSVVDTRAERTPVGDVRGRVRLPKGVPPDDFCLAVEALGRRRIERDGSYLLPDVPVGAHVVHVVEAPYREDDAALVTGREWDRSISCPLGSTPASEHGLGVVGFIVDVDGAGTVTRDYDLRRRPANRVEGRVLLDGRSLSLVDRDIPHSARIVFGPDGTTVAQAAIDAEGRFELGLDMPRAARLVLTLEITHQTSWRVEQDVVLSPQPTVWSRDFATGVALLEPAWIDAELAPPADLFHWQGPDGLEVRVLGWHEDPATRARRFDAVPAGNVVLHGRRTRHAGRAPQLETTIRAGATQTLRVRG